MVIRWSYGNVFYSFLFLFYFFAKFSLKYAPAALLNADFGPVGRNQRLARRGTILLACHPDLRLPQKIAEIRWFSVFFLIFNLVVTLTSIVVRIASIYKYWQWASDGHQLVLL